MDEKPSQPGEVTPKLELTELGNSGGAADRGKAAFIEVMEVAAAFVIQRASDVLGHESALLYSDRRDSWKQVAVLVFEASKVADYEDFRTSRNAEVRFDEHTARAV